MRGIYRYRKINGKRDKNNHKGRLKERQKERKRKLM